MATIINTIKFIQIFYKTKNNCVFYAVVFYHLIIFISERNNYSHIPLIHFLYSKYETGENDIPTQILIKLSNFYNTSIDYLLGQTNNPKRN